MRAELPDRGATHREATDEETVVVDIVALASMGVGLPEVDLARELVGAAVTTVKMKHQAIGRRDLADVCSAVFKEGEFAQGFSAAVTPEVETRERTRIVIRDDHTVGLDGPIDLRTVAAYDQTRLTRPRGLALQERSRARLAFGDKVVSDLEFSLVEILVIFAGPIRRLVEDFQVGQEFLETWVLRLSLGGGVDGCTQFGQLLVQRHLVGFRQGHGLVGRRDRTDSCRDIVLRAIGQNHGGKKGKEQEGAHSGINNRRPWAGLSGVSKV